MTDVPDSQATGSAGGVQMNQQKRLKLPRLELSPAGSATGGTIPAPPLQDSHFRRPTTTNWHDYWYCPVEQWQQWEQESVFARGAWQQLRRYDWAGRIMETEEGMAAPLPCQECRKRGLACRVFADRDDTACAFCKLRGRTACKAKPRKVQDSKASLQQLTGFVYHLNALLGEQVAFQEASMHRLFNLCNQHNVRLGEHGAWINAARQRDEDMEQRLERRLEQKLVQKLQDKDHDLHKQNQADQDYQTRRKIHALPAPNPRASGTMVSTEPV